ncbi:chromosome partitioning protein, partial [Micromonospora phytophila]|nr:chromosome partitioning protein [Micromonospora phytophila]
MVDENADRVHVPGQPPVPERDIEPLWPPDQVDGGAPSWAATAGPPAVPGQGQPPSPADYPSLTGGVAVPGGWAVSGTPEAASGWAPPAAASGWGPDTSGQGWASPTFDTPAPVTPGTGTADTPPTPDPAAADAGTPPPA